MKVNIYLWLLLFTAAPFQAASQNLLNNQKDTLQQYESFYYSTLKEKKDFKQSLSTGLYVLIFDEKVDLENLSFSIKRRNNAPIIYLRHNGYFSFEVTEPVVTDFSFHYEGDLSSSGSFAKLYWVIPSIIGTPYPDFNLKEISGNELKKDDLLGNVTVFLLWNPQNKNGKIHYDVLNGIASNYQDINFVAFSDVPPSRIKNIKEQYAENHFIFTNDRFQKLGKWTNTIPGNGSVILIVNKDGLLEYKNMISEDHPIFQKQLKYNITKKLDSLL